MANVVVIGAQWGDEGKGKIVDWLSRARRHRRALPGRPQRRPHAGHRQQDLQAVAAALGRGAAGQARRDRQRRGGRSLGTGRRDRRAAKRRASRSTPSNLRIAENATLILPLHRELDQLRESAAGEGKIGTTGRGIGPAYEDKVGRRAIRAQDLKNLGTLGPKIDRLLVHHNALRRGLGKPEIERRTRWSASCARSRRSILPYRRQRVGAARRASAAPASASCSRARRARCSTSTTAPIRS